MVILKLPEGMTLDELRELLDTSTTIIVPESIDVTFAKEPTEDVFLLELMKRMTEPL